VTDRSDKGESDQAFYSGSGYLVNLSDSSHAGSDCAPISKAQDTRPCCYLHAGYEQQIESGYPLKPSGKQYRLKL